MKQLIFALLFCVVISAQSKMNEQEAMDESHIDFNTQYLYFVIHGNIEIDGHSFCNDSRECPIIFQATLDGITIIDTCTNTKYTHRKCGVKGCKLIHLVKYAETINESWRWPNLQLYNDAILTHPVYED